MPVEFLSDEEAAAYGGFAGPPSPAELARWCLLDDTDLKLVERRRVDHLRLGFALQLVTVRALGTFLADPLEVPSAVLDDVAGQLGTADPSCVKRYVERRQTRFDHQAEIIERYGYRPFADASGELERWVDDRAFTAGEGPKALFYGAVTWLRERQVLLPGVSTLARLVARVRDTATQRLYEALSGQVSAIQARQLGQVLEVPAGARVSRLERWRHGPRKPSGKAMVTALARVAEVAELGLGQAEVGVVPARRVAELARYGMAAKAPALRRMPHARRVATLLATVRWLEVNAVDDALELFDVLMTTELLGRAEREASSEKLRRYPLLSKHAGRLAAAVEVMLEATEDDDEALTLDLVWDAIENVVSRAELRTAVASLSEVLPPPDADPDGGWRAHLVERLASVRGFLPLLCRTITFGATAEAAPILAALQVLPELLEKRATKKVPPGWLDQQRVAVEVVPGGWWHRLVFPPNRPDGTVAKAAYVFCVLEAFHRHLGRRNIYAQGSARWADPRAQLLAGDAWEAAKAPALNALGLPEAPDDLLAARADELDTAWRHAAAGFEAGQEVRLDERGRLHAAALPAVPDPPSLTDLRTRVEAMLPAVDLPELVLEVIGWHPGFAAAFTPASGGTSRLEDVRVSIAAALCKHALNVSYTPITADTPALSKARLSHVDQNYLRPANYAAANAVLITAQADLGLAQAWGGGQVAAVDGMRFVVPVRSVHTRPNPRYFGQRRRGATWLNMISDQAVGTAGKVMSGTPRDSLHLIDLIYAQDGGRRPEVVITDTGSYSDVVFGLLALLGFDYRPALADLPDAKLWRIDPSADYGPLNPVARGRIDLARLHAHWPDILRVVASIHTGTVAAHDVIRVLARGGNLTQLGEAIASYGRIAKTRHVLASVDAEGGEPYRRQIKAMRNLQEGRHALARHIFHGRRGELQQPYREGMEDQLGALGLILNCVTLWNTVYLNAALEQLRSGGYPIVDDDVAHLSAYLRGHINVHGHYAFIAPARAGLRSLRDPDATDDLD